ncbi:MAG: LamG domain-containing protein [Proteobacteria bacterium]|nr:MAG: LamG domain-containing protein [Pseudomonadota bacterium]
MGVWLPVMTRLLLISLLFLGVDAQASPPTMLQGVLGVSRCSELTPANAPQVANLDSIWHLNEPSFSSTFLDSSGGGHDLSTSVPFGNAGSGKVRSAARSRNGNSGFSTTKPITNPQTFTISAWMKISGARGGIIAHFANAQQGGAASRDRFFAVSTSGQLEFGIYNGSIKMITSPLSYNDGAWHHVAVRFTAAVATLFVDGVNIGSQNLGTAEGYNGYWRLAGGDQTNWGILNTLTPTFLGVLDELAIFNVALTDSEITALASSPSELNSSNSNWANAVGVWHFNETETLYQDSSANGNHVIGALPNPEPGFFGTGYLGPAPLFIGSNSTTLSPNTMSIALWFRSKSGGLLAQFANNKVTNAGTYDRQLALQTDGSVRFGTYTGSVFTYVTSPPGFNDGQWHHLSVTYKTGEQSLYIDGVQVATASPGTAQTFTGYWLFGNGNISGWALTVPSSQYVGDIDEIGFWRAILTPSDVLALYNKQRICP